MNPQIRRLALDLGPLLIFCSLQVSGNIRRHRRFHGGGAAGAGDRLPDGEKAVAHALVHRRAGDGFWRADALPEKRHLHQDEAHRAIRFFGAVLLGGLSVNRLFIKYVFAQAFELDELGWRKLTVRWGIFFLALAVLNETIWRSTTTATWVSFKVWGIIPLIFLFALAQTPLLLKHQRHDTGGTQD